REFWAELVVPAYERFKAEPNRASAIDVSVHAWHVHEWIWHDQNPGQDELAEPAGGQSGSAAPRGSRAVAGRGDDRPTVRQESAFSRRGERRRRRRSATETARAGYRLSRSRFLGLRFQAHAPERHPV